MVLVPAYTFNCNLIPLYLLLTSSNENLPTSMHQVPFHHQVYDLQFTLSGTLFSLPFLPLTIIIFLSFGSSFTFLGNPSSGADTFLYTFIYKTVSLLYKTLYKFVIHFIKLFQNTCFKVYIH